MKRIRKYHELIQSLDSREWQLLINYLKCFGSNHEAEKKMVLLAELLRGSSAPKPVHTYSYRIYKKQNTNALKQLAMRLKNRTLDLLSADISNIHHSMENKDADAGLVELRRKCVHYQKLLHSKPDMEIRNDLLEEIIKMAKEYEDYATLIHHLHLKKWIGRVRKQTRTHDKIVSDIKKYEKCQNAVITACDYVHELKDIEEGAGKRNEIKVHSFFERTIPHLQYLYTQTHSPYVLYYLRTLELSRLMFERNFVKARSKALELLKTIKENRSIFKIQRIGITYAVISICEIHMRKFEDALAFAKLSVTCYPKGHYNYIISRQYEFYCLFYLKQYIEAQAIAKEIIGGVGRKHLGDFRYEKFYFLLACSFFKLNQFEDAISILNHKISIKEDKEGWEFAWRLLHLMTYIELQMREKASSQTDALYVFMHDNKNKCSFSPRQREIVRFLQAFEKCGFEFSQINNKARFVLHQLKSNNDEYSWNILSAELIPFHEWIYNKTMTIKRQRII